jgi:hypothetical protein
MEARLVEINQELNQPTIGRPETPSEPVQSPEGTLPSETARFGLDALPAETVLRSQVPDAIVPGELTTGVAESPASTAPGEIAVGQQPTPETPTLRVGAGPEAGQVGGIGGETPTGISNKSYEAIYGEGGIPTTTGRGPAALKAFGQTRLADYQATGNPSNDPYVAISKAQTAGIMAPDDVPLVRAEHQRLVESARAAEGTKDWAEKSQFASDFANRIQQLAKGPASESFRAMQETDLPKYDNLTDFDQAFRQRMGREMDLAEKYQLTRTARDVKNATDSAGKEADQALNRTRQYRPKDKISFEEATKNLHDQITELTKDCIL